MAASWSHRVGGAVLASRVRNANTDSGLSSKFRIMRLGPAYTDSTSRATFMTFQIPLDTFGV